MPRKCCWKQISKEEERRSNFVVEEVKELTPRHGICVVEKMAASSAAPPRAAARMPVKTKAKKLTAEKKKTPVEI